MFKRIVAFGCSYTFGDALPDLGIYNVKKGMPCSIYSWPIVLAKKMDKEVINKGISGASNREICYEILNFKFKKTDLVIINWSFIERSCIIQKNNISPIGFWKQDKFSRMYYKYLFDHDNELFSLYNFTNYINLYLNYHQIHNIHALITAEYINYIPDWNVINYFPVHLHELALGYPKATDKKHPGKEAHEMFSKHLYNYLGQKN